MSVDIAPTAGSSNRRITVAVGLDLLSVLIFVVVGRRNHESGFTVGGTVETAAPFVIGLVLGWLVLRAWRRPFDWVVGAALWACTLVVGLVLRRLVFDDGTAPSFMIVTALFLAVTMIGWRLVAWLISRR